MTKAKWLRPLAFTVLTVTLVSGCSFGGAKDSSGSIDPPPGELEAQMLGERTDTDALMQDEAGKQVRATLYFKDSMGFVTPLSVSLAETGSPAKKALELMVEGSKEAKQRVPADFTGLLPAGTKVRGIDIKEKKAVVDFSKEFTGYNPQDERKILEAITWTLTGFPSIHDVVLQVEGTPLTEMPVAGTPLDEPLTRGMGINIEMPDAASIGQTTPVTVYFRNLMTDGTPYFVPVTRMVNRTDNKAQAALDQLLKGPGEDSELAAVMPMDVEILSMSQNSDMITVNLSSGILGEDKKAPAESLQSVILSLTDTTGISKVQILVDGQSKISDTANKQYSQPVARPRLVNEYKL